MSGRCANRSKLHGMLDDANYLASAPSRPFVDALGEARRDPSGALQAVLDATGGRLPVLAGYALGPPRSTVFGRAEPCFAFGRESTLWVRASGVELYHAGRRAPYAPSVASALRRLVARDRAARAGYSFRVEAPAGAALAARFGCEPSQEWPGFFAGERAVIEQLHRCTDVDCASVEAAILLLEIAQEQGLPLSLREDGPPSRAPLPSPAPSLASLELPPRRRYRNSWLAGGGLRVEVRGDAVVQTRLALGVALDVRIARPGRVEVADVGRAIGGERVKAWLEAQRASRALGAGGDPSDLFEAELGGFAAAGPWGGVEGLLIGQRSIEAAGARFGEVPEPFQPEQRVQRLEESGVDGRVCGWLPGEHLLLADPRGRLATINDVGDDHLLASGPSTLFEKLAVRDVLWDRGESPLVLEADLAPALAARLGGALVREASDEVSELFALSGLDDAAAPLAVLERCRFPRRDGAPLCTLLWAEMPEPLLAMARLARDLAPTAKLTPCDASPASHHRRVALRQAGLSAALPLP